MQRNHSFILVKNLRLKHKRRSLSCKYAIMTYKLSLMVLSYNVWTRMQIRKRYKKCHKCDNGISTSQIDAHRKRREATQPPPFEFHHLFLLVQKQVSGADRADSYQGCRMSALTTNLIIVSFTKVASGFHCERVE